MTESRQRQLEQIRAEIRAIQAQRAALNLREAALQDEQRDILNAYDEAHRDK